MKGVLFLLHSTKYIKPCRYAVQLEFPPSSSLHIAVSRTLSPVSSSVICSSSISTPRTYKLFRYNHGAPAEMLKQAKPLELPTHSFPSAAAFEAFLEREHETAAGLFLKLAKKSSGIASITAAEAVETALCFGWIDGRANSIDESWWTVRYTPRRSKSIWSQKNVTTIGRLTEQGRMRPAGLATVEAAKADGRWDRAYAGPATITVPADLATALEANTAAAAFFESLNKSDRYAVLWRVQTSSPQSRAKRIGAIVQTLASGKRPGAPAELAPKSKKTARVQKPAQKATAAMKLGKSKQQEDIATAMEESQARHPRREGLRRRP